MDPLILALIYKICWTALGGCTLYGGVLALKTHTQVATAKMGTKKDLGNLVGKDGIKVSKNFQLTFKKSCEGVLVIAPPGEHKTSSVNIPNLLTDTFPTSSMVIGDIKGELYDKTHEYLESIGYLIILYDPLNGRMGYNPLENCKSFSEVRYLASNILSNGELAIQLDSGKSGGSSEWINMSIPLLTACLLISKDIPSAILLVIYKNLEELLIEGTENGNKTAMDQFKIFQACGASEKTMASIKSTLLSNVALFLDPNLISHIKSNNFTGEMLRKQPIALYIKYSNPIYLSPFLSIFYTQLINQVAETKGIPVIFNLDEFQNLGRINIMQTLATCRDKNMAFIISIQNMARLNAIYGIDNTMTILNCLKTKCVLPSISDTIALKYLSELCGNTEIKIDDALRVKPIFSLDEIRRINDDEILIIPHNKHIFLDKQNTYYNQAIYKERLL